ncbi:MAG TPA: cupredoxin domain-containing protein [Acidimicrobiales bacterium]|nr:cupredoxin domain-containing protein [Acidimicrobiales bacterium]
MRSLLRRFILVGVLVLVLGACGSDSTDVAQTGTATSEDTPTTTTATTVDDGSGSDTTTNTSSPDTASEGADEMTVVEVEMQDFGYEPSELMVRAGEPVRFVFTNTGKVEHEAMIATARQQEELASGGHGDHHHGEGDGEIPSITLAPGESGTLEVTFDEPGELLLGCHLPGHWEAGMRSSLTVT